MSYVEEVKQFYDDGVQKETCQEWERLGVHRAEFEITKAYLRRYVKPGDRVLDVGGGPGRYSLFLAGLGCEVTLVDLSEQQVAFARAEAQRQGLEITALAGDACTVDTLLKADESFDHVLLMGPLYHLQQPEERIQAVNAALRLLKPGGVLYTSFISSYAGLIYYMREMPEMILDEAAQEDFEQFAEDRSFSGRAFTQAYFARISEVLPFFEQFPLQKLHYLSQEGMLAPNEKEFLVQSEEAIQAWIALALRVCEREDLLSYAEHLMYIGRKAE